MGNGLVHINRQATGEKIKRYMKANHLNAANVQNYLFMSSSTNVYQWLRGETMPSLERFVQLGRLLGVSLDKLIVIEGEEDNE